MCANRDALIRIRQLDAWIARAPAACGRQTVVNRLQKVRTSERAARSALAWRKAVCVRSQPLRRRCSR
eukprot:4629658-Pleurochrysis_carterae.AAC.1